MNVEFNRLIGNHRLRRGRKLGRVGVWRINFTFGSARRFMPPTNLVLRLRCSLDVVSQNKEVSKVKRGRNKSERNGRDENLLPRART